MEEHYNLLNIELMKKEAEIVVEESDFMVTECALNSSVKMEDEEPKDIVMEIIRKQNEIIVRATSEANTDLNMQKNPFNIKFEANLDLTISEVGNPEDIDIEDLENFEVRLDENMQQYPDRNETKEYKSMNWMQNYSNHFLLVGQTSNAEVTRGVFDCDLCKKVISNGTKLLDHLIMEHLTENRCALCDFSSVHENVLMKHVLTIHINRLKCPFDSCIFRTLDPPALDVHLTEVHKKIRPFKCTKCDRSYSEKSKWDAHACGYAQCGNSSKKKRTLKCKLSDRVFPCPTSMKKHQRFKHAVSEKSECDICQVEYRGSNGLKAHWNRVHAVQQQYKCEECPNTSFSRQQSLTMHQRRKHSLIEKSKCDICQIQYRNSNGFKTHWMRIHRKQHQYKCEQCPNTSFSRKQWLTRHQRHKHILSPKSKCHMSG